MQLHRTALELKPGYWAAGGLGKCGLFCWILEEPQSGQQCLHVDLQSIPRQHA